MTPGMGPGPEVEASSEKQEKQRGKHSSHKESISLEILQVLKEAQGQHGLKHGDYQRYRSYCSRRIRRLRKSLNFVQASGSKSRSSYQAKKITEEIIRDAVKAKKDGIRYLLLPLMCAERCWAYAMGLKQEANTEPRKRFHLVRKLRKSVQYALELETLCNQTLAKCDARTKLESQAYFSYLSGVFFFETEKWQKASEYLKKAQAIYLKLCEAIGDEEVAVHYRQRIDELKPTLRYCAFNIGEQDIDIDKLKSEAPNVEDEFLAAKLDQLILQTREKQAVTLSEINWLGRTLAVKQEKVRSFLLTVQEIEAMESPKVTQLEKLLFECRDCVQMLRETNQEKSALYCYLLYLRQRLTCRRNLQLIKTLQNQSELIRPYETIIGSLNEIKSLPIDQYFNAEDETEKFFNEIDAQTVAFKAFRCYYIGKAGKLSWKESLALLHRSSLYSAKGLANDFLTEDLREQLKKLQAVAEADKFSLYANSLIEDDSKTSQTASIKGKPKALSERLELYLEDSAMAMGTAPLANFPPQFRPIPCKPLFFDLALNHVEFPSLESEMTSARGGGITGLVKGWLSGGWKK